MQVLQQTTFAETTRGEQLADNVARDSLIIPITRWTKFLAWGLASVLLAAGTWQILVMTNILPTDYFPDIATLVSAWAGLFTDPAFWSALGSTFYTAIVGLILGIVVGVPVGIAVGRNDILFHATRFIFEFARPVPTVALIPVIVLFFGIGVEAKLLLVFLAVVFPLVVQTVYGVRDVDPVALDTATVLRLNRWRRLIQVLLPASGPYIMTGIRITASIALLVSVSTEIIIGAPGLGLAITNAENSYALDRMYALIAMTGIIGVVLNVVVTSVEKRTSAWARVAEEGN
ncbi:MAG TPA: ABC transporter permease [Enteractinococcus helveticum]|uniref:ABC transporter permease n=1 Tax=Enteractinococcus helveticum TaxID=1837282 RepID=A0A921FKD5_9MICC|nr:ABC transporter permease [Enteractinococcus helveticum]HJF13465.1 ABC transporter permease [Enteractinococcus helveticum]